MAEEKIIETPETNAPTIEDLQKQLEESNKQIKNLKATLSERNSEAANRKREAEDWRQKYESTLGEAELKEQQRAQKEAETAEKLARLERTNTINDYKAKYLSMGYPEDLAQSSAEARVDGNDDVYFANEAKFTQMVKDATKAELLKQQPSISNGEPVGAKQVAEASEAQMRKWFGLPTN